MNPDNISDKEKLGNVNSKEIYKTYQNRLFTLNVVDYGDLLLHNINIF